jgi:hypothetical protein
MVLSWLYRILGLPRSALLVDFGGGEGLLVRLLRDVGINALFVDKYGSGSFARAFHFRTKQQPAVVTSFEVWEHFPDPAAALADIFALSPRYLFVSTEFYKDQGPDWWYLAPEDGQHVFFYSAQAIRQIADRYAYRVTCFTDRYALFSRIPLTTFQRAAIRLILTGRLAKVLKSAMPFFVVEESAAHLPTRTNNRD